MNYKIITLPHVSFIQVLKTVKYGSAVLPTQAIMKAKKEVQKPAVGTVDGGKHGPYKWYSSTLRAETAKC